jgi:hypothetical protein
MKNTIVTRGHLLRKTAVLLCLLCSLVVSACTPAPTLAPTPTPTPTLISIPTIVSSRPCELSPGVSIPLAVTGVSGTGVAYSWSASAGNVIPPDGPTVAYTAPNTAGDVIIRVVAQKDGRTSTGMITCRVEATPTPNPTATYTPSATATYTPSPTATSTSTPSQTPPPTNPPPPLCEGSNSSELMGKAWAGTPEVLLACTQLIIDRWAGEADKQQAERVNSGCRVTPPDTKDAKSVDSFLASYWAVNDVGTAWFLRGEALTKLGRTTEAKEAYKTVRDKYSCAYTWDPAGKLFWNVSDAAQGK